jgi:hypothetical protein
LCKYANEEWYTYQLKHLPGDPNNVVEIIGRISIPLMVSTSHPRDLAR